MKGLLIKEWHAMGCMGGGVAVIGIVMIGFGLLGRSADQFVGMITGAVIMLSILPVLSSFTQDQASGWDKYALSMPLNRKQILGSKYLLGVFSALAGSAINLAVMGLAWRFVSPETHQEHLLAAGITFLLALVLQGILLPLIYRFGLERARLFLLGICLIPAMAVLLLEDTGWFDRFHFPELSAPMLLLIGIAATAVLMLLSYGLSLRFLTRKDL